MKDSFDMGAALEFFPDIVPEKARKVYEKNQGGTSTHKTYQEQMA